MNYRQAIAENIKYYCEAQHISIIDLCNKAKISRTTYYNIINENVDVTVKILGKIAKVLNVRVEDLL